MIKISTIFILGICIFFIQFLGIPMGWKNFLYAVFGLAIAILSILIRRELHEVLRHLHTENINTETFSENKPKQAETIQ